MTTDQEILKRVTSEVEKLIKANAQCTEKYMKLLDQAMRFKEDRLMMIGFIAAFKPEVRKSVWQQIMGTDKNKERMQKLINKHKK